MQSTLWNYFSGYVIIAVKGFSWEKFINSAISLGIPISNVVYGTSCAEMKVPLKDYRKLKLCARRSCCRIRIIKKCGLPFTVHRLQKQGLFMWGMLLFVVLIFILSTFLWEVNVTGAYRIPKKDILSFAYECGIFPGANKKNIDTDKAAKSFIMNFDDISWISIKIQGTSAEISIAEAIEKSKSPLKEAPSNIVAAKDGIIDKIYVSSGNAVVSEGDTVFKGDVLISGNLINPVDGSLDADFPVASSGKVFARNTYNYSLTLPKTHREKIPEGNPKNSYVFSIFGKELSLPLDAENKLFEKEVSEEKSLAFGDYSLPFSFRKETITFYSEKTFIYTAEEAESILNNRLWTKISQFDDETEVLEKNLVFSENSDSFILNAELTVSENIGKEEKF